jgi:hypothetical protein
MSIEPTDVVCPECKAQSGAPCVAKVAFDGEELTVRKEPHDARCAVAAGVAEHLDGALACAQTQLRIAATLERLSALDLRAARAILGLRRDLGALRRDVNGLLDRERARQKKDGR